MFPNVSNDTFGVYPKGVPKEPVVVALGSLPNEKGGDAIYDAGGGEPIGGSVGAGDGVGLDGLLPWRIAERNGAGR